MNDLIRVKLKEIVKLLDIIKKDDLNYKSKFWLIFITYCFLRDIHEGYLSYKDVDDE